MCAKNPGWTSASRCARMSAANRLCALRQRRQPLRQRLVLGRRSSPSSRCAPSATAGSRVRARLTCSANAAAERGSGSSPMKARSQIAASTSCSEPLRRHDDLQRERRLQERRPAFFPTRERIGQREADQPDDACARRRLRPHPRYRATRATRCRRRRRARDSRSAAGPCARWRASPEDRRNPSACTPLRSNAGPLAANVICAASPSCARSCARSRPVASSLPRRIDDADVDGRCAGMRRRIPASAGGASSRRCFEPAAHRLRQRRAARPASARGTR